MHFNPFFWSVVDRVLLTQVPLLFLGLQGVWDKCNGSSNGSQYLQLLKFHSIKLNTTIQPTHITSALYTTTESVLHFTLLGTFIVKVIVMWKKWPFSGVLFNGLWFVTRCRCKIKSRDFLHLCMHKNGTLLPVVSYWIYSWTFIKINCSHQNYFRHLLVLRYIYMRSIVLFTCLK